MKKFFIVALSMLMTCGVVNAETSVNVLVRTENPQTELPKSAKKAVKKEAKELKKAGWIVAPGALPLEVQLERSAERQYAVNRDGSQKYIMGTGMSVGETYNAAKMQSTELAKLEVVSQLESQVTALVENSLANKQLSTDDAASITKTLNESKTVISNSLTRTLVVMECYRDTENKMKEVLVRVAYDSQIAANAAKQALRDALEKEGKELQKELDKLFENN